jgi:GGDEF domain-containing protein
MAAVESIVGKLIDALRRPTPASARRSGASRPTLGVSIFRTPRPTRRPLMEHADEGDFTAKQAGKNAYCLYSTVASSPTRGSTPRPE